jgi:hypothetical protein
VIEVAENSWPFDDIKRRKRSQERAEMSSMRALE